MIVALVLAAQITAALVPGTAGTWTDGVNTWAGNPFCGEGGLPQANSPTVDAGDQNCVHIDTFTLQCQTGPNDTPPNSTVVVPTFHCPSPGSALNQPRLPDALGSYCVEWYGAAPDIGACEYVASVVTPPPSYPIVLNVNPPPEEATVNIDATPAGNTAMLTVRMYDPDNPGEGELWINGNGPLRLFDDMVGATLDATGHFVGTDGLIVDVQFATPASWWVNGTNALRFVHLTSQGFRIEAQPTVQFSGALVVPAAPTNLGVQ